MTREKISKILIFISIALFVIFLTMVFIDYSNYSVFYSAPFSVYILARFLEFLLPSIIILIIAIILKRKKEK